MTTSKSSWQWLPNLVDLFQPNMSARHLGHTAVKTCYLTLTSFDYVLDFNLLAPIMIDGCQVALQWASEHYALNRFESTEEHAATFINVCHQLYAP